MGRNELPKDFKDFLRLLNSTGVEYMVVGGYAVGYYGYVRFTADIDFFIAADVQNAQRIVEALRSFGFPSGVPASTFTEARKVIRMGVSPVRIEILTSISGVDFKDAYQRRLVADIEGIPVNLIGLADLKANKRASGRLKDLADLEKLEQLPKK
jgi:predicted nucleotidyltransferase